MSVKKNDFIRFGETKLKKLDQVSYLELVHDPSGLQDSFHCIFCNKTTMHDHVLKSRIKFDPRGGKCLISFFSLKESEVFRSESKENVGVSSINSPPSQEFIPQKNLVPILVKDDPESAKIVLKHFTNRRETSLALKVMSRRCSYTIERVIETEYPNGVENCDICALEKFANVEAVVEHLKTLHSMIINMSKDEKSREDKTTFQCQACLQNFKNKRDLNRHKIIHDENQKRNHICQLCNKGFIKAQHLRSHYDSVHLGVKAHKCGECDKAFSSRYALNCHEVNTHNKEKRPMCQRCNKSFYTQTQLNKHNLQHHNKDPRLSCPHCKQFYLRKDNLDKHVQLVHGSEELSSALICKICKNSMKNQNALSSHLQSSHGILPWNKEPKESGKDDQLKCKICEHFFLKSELETHLRFSHGVMPPKPGVLTDLSVSEAAEALLRTLTPQPDYLLRGLTPLPMETLDDFFSQ